MKIRAALIALAGVLALPAAEAGDLLLRAGVHNVDPKSSNDLGLDVSNNATLTLGAAWFVTQNVAIDLLGAIPFQHDVKVSGVTIAKVKHLPPTLGVQYHFNPGGKFDPFVGAGVNVTLFFNEKLTDAGKTALGASSISASTTVGPALQLGGDIALANDWVLGLDLRWAKIGPDIKVDGTKIGRLDLDPLVYGVTIGRRFAL